MIRWSRAGDLEAGLGRIWLEIWKPRLPQRIDHDARISSTQVMDEVPREIDVDLRRWDRFECVVEPGLRSPAERRELLEQRTRFDIETFEAHGRSRRGRSRAVGTSELEARG